MQQSARVINPRPLSLVVFGSFARGMAGVDGDVDVIAVLPSGSEGGDDQWVASLGRWTDEVTRIVGNPVRLVQAREGEVPGLLRQSHSVWAEAVAEGIVLIGTRLESIGSVP